MSYTYYVTPEVRGCFKNGTPDSEILERINYSIPNESATVRRITKSFILIVSLLATIMTIIFIFAVIKAIKNHQVSRKCYVLILTRSFGDLLTSLCFLIFSIVQFTLTDSMATQHAVFQILVIIMNGAIWSEMISYNLLSGIKLYCVVLPLHYRNNFTFRRCLYLSSLSWITFVTIFLMNLIRYIVCNQDNCGPLYDQIQSAVYTGVHCFTVIFFVLTAIFVYRSRKFPDGQSTKKSKFPFSTYVIMLGIFIFVYSFLIANDIFFSFIFPHLNYCFKTLNEPSITAIKESIYILFLIRIFIDPIINCFIDKKIMDYHVIINTQIDELPTPEAMLITGMNVNIQVYHAEIQRLQQQNIEMQQQLQQLMQQIQELQIQQHPPQQQPEMENGDHLYYPTFEQLLNDYMPNN